MNFPQPIKLGEYVTMLPGEDWESVVLSDSQESIYLSTEELDKLIHMYHSHKSDKALREAALRDVQADEHIVLGTD